VNAAQDLRLIATSTNSSSPQEGVDTERRAIMELKGKKAIIIGDRDGIPGPAIEEVLKTAGVEVVFSSTECFV